jgi:proline dehydrogenase
MIGAVRVLWRALARRVARTYVVGPDLEDAARACRSLDAQGFRSTICFWNHDYDTPRDITERYMAAIDLVGAESLDCYVSVKAPPLQFSRDLFADIFNLARQRDVGIHFDSLWPEAADQTFSLINELLPKHAKIGCTLPSRWQRSLTDADRAVEMRLSVRVVKGQWADPEKPGIDPRAGFLRVIDRLAGRVCHTAVATHDPKLAREALMRLRATGTPCELELLFGLPVRRAIPVAKAMGVPVRIYVPYGHAWLPYVMGEVQKNPRIAWWLMRDLCTAARLNVARSRDPRLPNKPT